MAPAQAADPEVVRLQDSFEFGNFALVRTLAAQASSSSAKTTANLLMTQVTVEREQIIAGLIGLVVILIACALTLT